MDYFFYHFLMQLLQSVGILYKNKIRFFFYISVQKGTFSQVLSQIFEVDNQHLLFILHNFLILFILLKHPQKRTTISSADVNKH